MLHTYITKPISI